MTIIPVGYRLIIRSWENDLDCQLTKELSGLTEKDVKLMIDLCNLLKSGSKYANMWDPSDRQIRDFDDAIREVLVKHDDPEPEYDLVDIYDGTGLIQWFEFYTRVVEEIRVEWIPNEIHIEDVTSKFIS